MTRWIGPGGQANENPAIEATMAPTLIWPSAPMLNNPARKPRATERPPKISGVAVSSVSETGENEFEIWATSPDRKASAYRLGLPSAPVNRLL